MSEPLLEVIATSVDDAIEAERGGATRIEAVRDLECGGLTPPLPLVHAILAAVRIPVRAMLRVAPSYEVASEAELERLCDEARALTAAGVEGLVLGFARGTSLDLVSTVEILASVPGVRATFHHAFDEADDPCAALRALKMCGRIDCILTHGVPSDGVDRAAYLRALVHVAGPEIAVMVGGGLDEAAIQALRPFHIPAFHVGRAVRIPRSAAGRVSAARVHAIAMLVGDSAAAASFNQGVQS